MTVFGGESDSDDDERIMETVPRNLDRATEAPGRAGIFERHPKSSLFWRGAIPLIVGHLMFAAVVGASTRCTIELDVTDGGREPIEGVDITIDGPGLVESRTLLTDAAGMAVALGLPAGSFRLVISRQGFQWLEILDVQCDPMAVVRLPVTLEQTDGDDVVILPSGPSVDPEATTVSDIRSQESRELLPRSEYVQTDIIGFQPVDAVAFVGTSGADIVIVPRQPENRPQGRVSIAAGAGLRADTTGTRGEVSTIDNAWQTRFSAGGFSPGSRLGAFFSLQADGFDVEDHVEIVDQTPAGTVDRRRQSDHDAGLAYGVLSWAPVQNNRLDLRLNWGRQKHERVASSLFVTPESPLPGGDDNQKFRATGVRWQALVSETAVVRVDAGYRNATVEWVPENDGLMEQDQTPDGSWSGGIGNGVWVGVGGVAGLDRDTDATRVETGLEWMAGSRHRLGIDGWWSRKVDDLRYRQPVSGDGLGVRRTHRGPVAERWDRLVSGDQNRGVVRSGGLLFQDNWRVTDDLTVVVGLQVENLQFEPDGARSGYRFAFQDTVSPRVGLVWDFEGSGRSRAWVRWARFRPGPGPAVQSRMAGAFDVETVFVDDNGNQRLRVPGPVDVASDLEPMVVDETVVGIEYEILSHLVVGAAAAGTRSRNGLAVLTADGGETFVLDTPSGDVWPEHLARETLESWGWIRKRLANGWQAELLVGWRQSVGTSTGSSSIDVTDLDREYLADVVSPEALSGARGPLPDDRRWRLAASGSWRFSAGPSLGGRLTYKSGAPLSRLGSLDDGLGLDRRFIASRGSAGRTPELWRLDVIGSWPFEIGSVEIEAFFDISNLLNSQRAIRLDERWTVLDDAQEAGLDAGDQSAGNTWGEPLMRQRPLEVRLGLVYRW